MSDSCIFIEQRWSEEGNPTGFACFLSIDDIRRKKAKDLMRRKGEFMQARIVRPMGKYGTWITLVPKSGKELEYAMLMVELFGEV